MKNSLLIALIMICSLISGLMWSVFFTSLTLSSWENRELKNSKKYNSQVPTVSLKQLESEITQIVEKISPSVVSIVISKDLPIFRSDPWGFFQEPAGSVSRKIWGWSGFFISEDGKILTNKHVVSDKNADYTVVLKDGSEYSTEILALDPINDLAVIQIVDAQKKFTPLIINQDISELQIGQFGIAIWNALAEFQNSVSLWIISGKNRSITASGETLSGLLQTDAAINPGNSWGPLVSLNGEVVWINTAIAAQGNSVGFAFALSAERIEYILQSIEKSWRIKKPFIGINYIDITPRTADQFDLSVDYWAYIFNEDGAVVGGSSAEKNGIEPWDIILEVGWVRVQWGLLTSIIQNALPGDILNLKILKKSGKQKNITLELGEL